MTGALARACALHPWRTIAAGLPALVLVPAAMQLRGRRNRCLPRWLPRIDVEGASCGDGRATMPR